MVVNVLSFCDNRLSMTSFSKKLGERDSNMMKGGRGRDLDLLSVDEYKLFTGRNNISIHNLPRFFAIADLTQMDFITEVVASFYPHTIM